jgi:hypothetical protein
MPKSISSADQAAILYKYCRVVSRVNDEDAIGFESSWLLFVDYWVSDSL